MGHLCEVCRGRGGYLLRLHAQIDQRSSRQSLGLTCFALAAAGSLVSRCAPPLPSRKQSYQGEQSRKLAYPARSDTLRCRSASTRSPQRTLTDPHGHRSCGGRTLRRSCARDMWERPVASAPRALLYECRPVPYRPSREVQRVRVPVGTPTRPARDPIGAPRSSYPLSPTLWTASSLLLITPA